MKMVNRAILRGEVILKLIKDVTGIELEERGES